MSLGSRIRADAGGTGDLQGGVSSFEVGARQGTIPARGAVHRGGGIGQGSERDGIAILRLLLLQRLWLLLQRWRVKGLLLAGNLLLGLVGGRTAVVRGFLLELWWRRAGDARGLHGLVLILGLRRGDLSDLIAAGRRLAA